VARDEQGRASEAIDTTDGGSGAPAPAGLVEAPMLRLRDKARRDLRAALARYALTVEQLGPQGRALLHED
jgi:hypothetical protein